MIVQGDAKDLPFADQSFDCVVTSPPYFGLRRYGHSPDEIGTGSLSEYLDDISQVAHELRRVLKDDGLFWLNIGDTASGSGGAGGDYNKGGTQDGRPKWKQGDSGLAKKQWCMVPSRVALMLQEEGWLLRSEITWDKERLRPESLDHVSRPGISHEKIFMFAKQPKHRFYPKGLIEKGSVWHFPPVKKATNHLAPFPIDIPTRAIKCSTQPGDVVFDPFAGCGTTLRAAHQTGRVGVGLDLYDYEVETEDG